MNPASGSALVTGGSRGIGRAICVELAHRGYDVAFSYLRNDAGADETQALIADVGRRGLAIRSRVDTRAACTSLVERAGGELGGLRVVVSNVATGVNRPVLEVTEKHWDWTLNTNCRALLFLAQAAHEQISRAGGGAILAISSLGATRVLPDYALVGVSKAALECAVRYLAVELAPGGIRVNAVSGGLVETDALDHFPRREELLALGRRAPTPRLLEPLDIARAVAWLASDEAAMVIGQTLIVDGGASLRL